MKNCFKKDIVKIDIKKEGEEFVGLITYHEKEEGEYTCYHKGSLKEILNIINSK